MVYCRFYVGKYIKFFKFSIVYRNVKIESLGCFSYIIDFFFFYSRKVGVFSIGK